MNLVLGVFSVVICRFRMHLHNAAALAEEQAQSTRVGTPEKQVSILSPVTTSWTSAFVCRQKEKVGKIFSLFILSAKAGISC